MVTPVRPSLTPPAGQTAGTPRTTAQRAFFDAAMGRAAAPVATAAPQAAAQPMPAAPAAPLRPPVQASANATPETGEPVRYRRPGSILDIKV